MYKKLKQILKQLFCPHLWFSIDKYYLLNEEQTGVRMIVEYKCKYCSKHLTLNF